MKRVLSVFGDPDPLVRVLRRWCAPVARVRARSTAPTMDVGGGVLTNFEPLEERVLLSTVTVNTPLDNNSADVFLSLREATLLVNEGGDANAALGRPLTAQEALQIDLTDPYGTNDTIEFDGTLIGETITLGGAELVIDADVTIDGPGAGALTIDGDGASRIFQVNSFNVTIDGLTLANGFSAGEGGAIVNSGTLAINESVITNNTAALNGGGIVNENVLTLVNSTVSDNIAQASDGVGGGILNSPNSVLTITGGTISGNVVGENGEGGGIFDQDFGTVTVADSTISSNLSGSRGGGIFANRTTLDVTNTTFDGNESAFSAGGAISSFDANVTIADSTLTGNMADDGGGAIANLGAGYLTVTNTTISGNTSNDGDGGGIFNDYDLTVTDSTISDNSASNYGGGIYNAYKADVVGSTISGNVSRYGGGVAVLFGTLAITDSTISDNYANDANGGAIAALDSEVTITGGTISGNRGNGGGGAVYLNSGMLEIDGATLSGNTSFGTGGAVEVGYFGTLSITDSVITENRAYSGGGGVFHYGRQGTITNTSISGNLTGPAGLYGGGGVYNAGTLTIADSVIDGNDATRGGGGIFNRDNATVTGTVISNNVTANEGGGIENGYNGTLTVIDSAISGNSADGFAGGGGIYSFRDLMVTGTTITNNTSGGQAGGIYARNQFTLTESTVSGNTATNSGGGIYTRNSTVNITDSAVDGNTSDRAGGGIYISSNADVMIAGSSISDNMVTAPTNGGGGIRATAVVTVDIDDTTISGNSAVFSGGGIYATSTTTFNIANSTISDNTVGGAIGGNGGGIRGANNVVLNIDNSTLSGNSAQNSGGGIHASVNTTTMLTNSTLSGNVADSDGGGIYGGFGSNSYITNATFSGNTAGDDGGGVYGAGGTYLRLAHATVTGNTAGDSGGGVHASDGQLYGSLISGNTAASASEVYTSGTYSSFYTVLGHSGIDDAAAFGGTFVPNSPGVVNATSDGINAPLNAILDTTLADNGGPTLTHALTPGSPAIDIVFGIFAATDQRGSGRPFPALADSGAVEEGFEIIVTTLVDENDGTPNPGAGTGTSLREAMEWANMFPDLNRITFLAGLAGGTITLTGGALPIIGNDVEIFGLGQTQLTVDGDGFVVFDILPDVDVDIRHLTMTGSISPFGAILNEGNLRLSFSTLTGNLGSSVGAILSTYGSSLTIVNSTFTDNVGVPFGAVASYGTASITGSTFSNNTGDVGGGVANFGTMSIRNSTISNNTAVDEGGGIFNGDGPGTSMLTVHNTTITGNIVTDAGGDGGGIYNADGSVTVTNSTITGNSASDDGGGIYNNNGVLSVSDSTISGNTAFVGLPGGPDGGGGVANYGAAAIATISNTTIDGNTGAVGGSILNVEGATLNVSDSTITNGLAYLGGGLTNEYGSTASITNSDVDDNLAFGRGGGIWNTGGSTLNVTDSSISGNSASSFADGDGGGIDNDSNSYANITRTTISNNYAYYYAGGIDNRGTLTLTNSTVRDNVGFYAGGGIYNRTDASMTITSTLLTGNTVSYGGGGAIHNDGDLSITDSALTDNSASYDGGAILTHDGDTTISGSFISGNIAGDDGGGISAGTYGTGGTLTITDTTIRDNSAGYDGGGVYNAGIATITNSLITNNESYYDGGGIFNEGDYGGSMSITGSTISNNRAVADGFDGGGIFNDDYATMTITDTTITGNSAEDEGGGVFNDDYTTLTIAGSTIADNYAGDDGGGILNDDAALLTITDTVIRDNTADDEGGGIANEGGTVTITDSTVTGNSAGDDGGGIANDYSYDYIDYYGVVTVTRTTISGNTAYDDAGGIETEGYATTTIIDSTITGNSAGEDGGGLDVHTDGYLYIYDSTVSDNAAESDGGGIYVEGYLSVTRSTISGNSALNDGGGIATAAFNNAVVTVTDSTISGNTADFGGGIYTDYLTTLTLHNSTVSGNVAFGAGGVAMIASYSSIVNSTISGNTAPYGAGGIFAVVGGDVYLYNNVISGNDGSGTGDEVLNGGGATFLDAFNLFGHDGITNAQAFIGFAPSGTYITATSDGNLPTALGAILSPLADNGGPTLTHALPAGSPAIDAGNDVPPDLYGIDTDQRGFERFFGAPDTVDLGAFEAQDFDFGDAPDSFGTLEDSNGALHTAQGPNLGATIDTEADGLPSADALGDDNDVSDDEDGITFTDTLAPGRNGAELEVFVTNGPAVLDAWIDFDHSGTFDDDERIFASTAVANGVNTLTYDIPLDALTGDTYARFRLSEAGVASPLGYGGNGEVEDYLVTLEQDFGDAPASYEANPVGGGVATVGMFTGSDPGEGLDLSGNFVYAVNARGPAIMNVGGVDFTEDTATMGVTLTSEFEIINWHDPDFDGGDGGSNGGAEGPLEMLMESIRWTNVGDGGLEELTIDLDVTPGETYKLQLLFAEQLILDRGFDIYAEGGLIVDDFTTSLVPASTTPTEALVVTYTFTATDDTLNILLDGVGSPFGDDNPIINAFTLEALDADPLSGAAAHGAYGPTLGADRDAETGPQSSADADGDDTSGIDDENGVVFTSPITPGLQDATVEVTVAGGPAVLDAWIDFNGNGVFDGASERIFDGVAVVDGVNTLTFDVPADALPGDTYARFRISTDGVAGPTGLALDGEVEDYAITIDNPLGVGLFADSGQSFDPNATDGALGDLDGDGDLDLFFANFNSGDQVFFNDGAGVFTDSGQSLGDDGSVVVTLGDVDGDGDLDAFVGNQIAPDTVWLNDGTGVFTDSGQSLANGNNRTHEIALGDLDGDGDLDAYVVLHANPDQIWLNDGSGVFTAGQSGLGDRDVTVALGDVDGDGDLDAVLGADGNMASISQVFLNDGSANFTDSGQDLGLGFHQMVLGDLDNDGDLDLFGGKNAANDEAWLNDGSGVFSLGQTFSNTAARSTVALGDLDGDGDLDAFLGNDTSGPNTLRVLLNNGDGTFAVSGQTFGLDVGPNATSLGDVDSDGDLDAVTFDTGDSRVWLNQPVGRPDTYILNEDQVRNGASVLTNDLPSGVTLTATLDQGPSNGTLELNADGTFTYTPDLDFNGTDTFTYLPTDGTSTGFATVVTLIVNPVNDDPIASDDAYTITEDTMLITGPEAFWRFEEAVGATVALDSSGNAHNGEYESGVTLGQTGYPTSTGNSALFDDSVNGEAVFADFPLSTRARTVSGWFNTASLADADNWQTIFYKGDDVADGIGPFGNREMAVYVNNAGFLQMSATAEGSAAESFILTAPGLVTANQWHHVAAVVDADNAMMHLFLDGVLVQSGGFSIDGIKDSSGAWRIGVAGTNGHLPFNGQLDDIAVFDRALSADEIAAVAAGDVRDIDSGGLLDNDNGVELSVLGTFQTNIFDDSAAEIVAYDAGTQRVFFTNSSDSTVGILDISDPTTPMDLGTIDVSTLPVVGATGGPNSVAVYDGFVAVAIEAATVTDPGYVAFYDVDGIYLAHVQVGALPDMLTFTPDGQTVLVANEGEPDGVDPDGSVSLIDVSGGVPGVTQGDVQTADFTAFNGMEASLRAQGVRIFDGNSVSQDVEPEFIAVSPDGTQAFITLQEANAFGILDIASATITDIVPMGFKDHSLPGNGFDPSDRDNAIDIRTFDNVFGMFMPDTIASFAVAGETYYVTANEGDDRGEDERVKNLTLDPTAFPNAADLQEDEVLGRLGVSTIDGNPDMDGDYDELYVYGTRSFSVWDASGNLVFDSGDDFEQILALVAPDDFNSNNDENDSFESRSDNKGPEPEAIEIGHIAGRTYAFIGLERQGGIMVYDVTVPSSPVFVEYLNNRDFSVADVETSVQTDGAVGDLGPESIKFISAAESPTGAPMLAVGNEVSGTVTFFHIEFPPNEIETFTTTLLSDVSHGTLLLNPNGTFKYTPDADFFGTDTFTYQLTDGNGGNDTATVTITVVPDAEQEVAPTVGDDAYMVNEDGFLFGASVFLNDAPANPADGPLTGAIVSGPSSELFFSFNAATGNFFYRPAADFNGTDTFTYTVTDANGVVSDTATVTITVNPVNDRPVGVGDMYDVDSGSTLVADGMGGMGGGGMVPAMFTVGYYDMVEAEGDPDQVAAILAAGGTPVDITVPDAAQLAGIDVFFVQNEANGPYGAEYVANLADIEAAVLAGMTLIIHDRHVDAESILPGGAGFDVRNDFTDDEDIDVRDNTTLVTNGPGGIIDDTTLDGGNSSSHGYTAEASLPVGAELILTRSDPTEIVTFAYEHGMGNVIYSSIPLDFYLDGNTPASFGDIYAPNVVAYGASLTNAGGGGTGVLDNDTDLEDGMPVSAVLVLSPVHAQSFTFNPDGSFEYRPVAGFTGVDEFWYRPVDSDGVQGLTTRVQITVNEVVPLAQPEVIESVVVEEVIINDVEDLGTPDTAPVESTPDAAPTHGLGGAFNLFDTLRPTASLSIFGNNDTDGDDADTNKKRRLFDGTGDLKADLPSTGGYDLLSRIVSRTLL